MLNNLTPITEELTVMIGFDKMQKLSITDNLFFYKHPNGFIRLAHYEEDLTDDIKTLERLQDLYFGLVGRKLKINWFS